VVFGPPSVGLTWP